MDSVDESDVHSPSTADIVAAQSQDYVDEKELEFRMTIQQLAGKWLHSRFLCNLFEGMGPLLKSTPCRTLKSLPPGQNFGLNVNVSSFELWPQF